MNTVTDDPVLNERQAADYLGCSPATLKLWRSKKIGPPAIRWNGGRSVRYRLSDLEDFIETSKNPTTSST